MDTLVLGLGNDLLADDAIGVLAARRLSRELAGQADVIDTSMHGLALLDYFLGYDRAILIDSVQTGRHPPGTILELEASDLGQVYAASPHYTGLPEMVELARQLVLAFPSQFAIFAVEVADTQTVGGLMAKAVRNAIPELCKRVRGRLYAWRPAN